MTILRIHFFAFVLASCILFGCKTDNSKKLHTNTTKKTQYDSKYRSLVTAILSADSVLLISHEETQEFKPRILPDWDSRDTSMNLVKWKKLHPSHTLSFFENGKINRKIIVESASLNDKNRNALVNILAEKDAKEILREIGCDEPRHSIIIYKDGNESYLDICFGCEKIHTSNDIVFDEADMNEKKWFSLKYFFQLNGLTEILKKYNE